MPNNDDLLSMPQQLIAWRKEGDPRADALALQLEEISRQVKAERLISGFDPVKMREERGMYA